MIKSFRVSFKGKHAKGHTSLIIKEPQNASEELNNESNMQKFP